MKKNEKSLDLDSFIIVESEKKVEKQNNILKTYKKNYTEKKIRNKLFDMNEDLLNSDEFNNNKKVSKNKQIINEEFEEFDNINNKDEENEEKEEIKDKNILKNDGFIYITNFSKEKPKDFEAEIALLNYKKNISYQGKINIYENFEVIINLVNKSSLYFNDSYFKFCLLEIKNFSTTQKYSYDDTWIEINLKDYRNFIINLKSKENFQNFLDILENFSNPLQVPLYFRHAFFEYDSTKNEKLEKNKNLYPNIPIKGWDIYNFESEFKRQKVDFNNVYNIIDNSNFKFCETYPEKIITPKLSKEILEKCAFFRKKERIPALTYQYKNKYCIWRSSQTKSGFTGKDDKDILYLTRITQNQNSKNIVVYDARPKLNAMANKLKGGGYENPNNYTEINMEVVFCDIPNIHSVRNSYEKLLTSISYINDNDYSVISSLQSTNWYETIILILKGGFQIYNSIKEENTVLIHCSDGWDRTSQLAALSQILLDEYYRTLKGFIILIEKDWLSFGHQFRLRNGFFSKEKRDEFSPIFIQWLDCIYQIMEQNLTKFEFNINLLSFIADNIYNGKYGTFLFNNEKERKENNAKNNTISIWDDVFENEKKYVNPIYDINNKEEIEINYKKIKLWKNYFFKYEKGENEINYINKYVKKENKYKKEIQKKDELIKNMCKIIINQGIDLDILNTEVKNEVIDYLEKSKINLSFEIMNPTESTINIKNKKNE